MRQVNRCTCLWADISKLGLDGTVARSQVCHEPIAAMSQTVIERILGVCLRGMGHSGVLDGWTSMEALPDVDLNTVSATTASEIIGQSIDRSHHSMIFNAIARHVDTWRRSRCAAVA